MKSRILSFSIMKENFKKQLWAPALLTLGFFLILPVAGMVCLEILQSRGVEQAEIIKDYTGFLTGVELPFLSIMTVGGAILNGIVGFSWLHSRVKTDFYHSLPIRREKIFLQQIILGFLYFAVPYLVNLALAYVVAIPGGVLRGNMVRLSLECFLYQCLFYMLIYLTVVLAMLLTGKTLVGLMGAFVLTFYVPLLDLLIQGYASAFFDTYASRQLIFSKFMGGLSPVMAYIRCLPDSSYEIPASVWGLGLLALAALLALSFFLYRKRPSEAAGRAMAFFRLGKGIQYLMEVLVALAFGLLFYSITVHSSVTWMAFGVLLGGALCHGIMEVIYEGDIRRVMAHPWMLGASVVTTALVVGIFWGDLLGYDDFFPKQESLKSLGVHVWEYNNPSEREYSAQQLEAMENQAQDPHVYEAVQAFVKNKLERRDTPWGIMWLRPDGTEVEEIRFVQVEYGLKNGRTTYRGYYVDKNACREQLMSLYDSVDYKKAVYPLATLTEEELEKVTDVEVYSIKEEGWALFEGNARARADFLKTYRADLMQLDADTLEKESPIGRLELTLEEETSFPSSGDDASPEAYYIYPSFSKTLAELEKQNVELPEEFLLGEVTRIYLYDRRNRDGDSEDVEIRDKDKIKEMLPYLVSSGCNNGFQDINNEMNALVTVRKKGYDMDVYCDVRRGEFPDF